MIRSSGQQNAPGEFLRTNPDAFPNQSNPQERSRLHVSA